MSAAGPAACCPGCPGPWSSTGGTGTCSERSPPVAGTRTPASRDAWPAPCSAPAASAESEALWTEHRVAPGRAEHKRFPHPVVGLLDLECEVLLGAACGQSLVIHTARPGGEAHERLRLLRVVGAQEFGQRVGRVPGALPMASRGPGMAIRPLPSPGTAPGTAGITAPGPGRPTCWIGHVTASEQARSLTVRALVRELRAVSRKPPSQIVGSPSNCGDRPAGLP
ncbi:MmyB family transcriptional regulator [Streptomyces sp. NPDC002540]